MADALYILIDDVVISPAEYLRVSNSVYTMYIESIFYFIMLSRLQLKLNCPYFKARDSK